MRKILAAILFLLVTSLCFAKEKNVVILTIENTEPAASSGIQSELFNLLKKMDCRLYQTFLQDTAPQADLILKGDIAAIRKHAAQYKADMLILCVNSSSEARQSILNGRKLNIFHADEQGSVAIIDIPSGEIQYSITINYGEYKGLGGTAEKAKADARQLAKNLIIMDIRKDLPEITVLLQGEDD